MELKSYFANATGLGILSTADEHGKVDAAVYSRPHFMDDGTVAFIMRDRLTHHNLRSNPHAAYLFKENGPGYNGRRLFLTKSYPEDQDRREVKYLVFFKVDNALPLIGPGRGNA